MLSILIVDDEVIVIRGLKKIIFEAMGDSVFIGEASDGVEALKAFDQRNYDVVITDIKMPTMDGVMLVKRISEHYPQTKTIVLSGYQNFEYVRAVLKQGASDYLLKPVENSELIALLEQFEKSVTSILNPVEIAKTYVKENYDKTITLQEISKLVHLNAAYFCQLFKKETNMSFNDYLVGYRVDKAKELLRRLDNRVYEIATQVGYSDPGYFSRIFKKATGFSPNEYRAKWVSEN